MNSEDVSFVKNAVFGLILYLVEQEPTTVMFKLFDVKPSTEEIEVLIGDVILEHGAIGDVYNFSGNDLEELKEAVLSSHERDVSLRIDEKDLN